MRAPPSIQRPVGARRRRDVWPPEVAPPSIQRPVGALHEDPIQPGLAADGEVPDLKIRKMPTAKHKIPQRPLMEADVIPRHPSSVIFNGSSNSGKTTLLMNLLTRPEFHAGYFDTIHLFSPTGGSDDLFKKLKIPKKNIHIDMDPAKLEKIMEKQNHIIETRGIEKAPKLLLIYEDVQGNAKFMSTKAFLRSFIANRHFGMSTWLCGQSFTRTPRACRLQANHIFYFKGSGSEMDLLAAEFAPPGMKKKKFMLLLEQGTRDPYDFIHINMRAPHAERYRRNLDRIIEWSPPQSSPTLRVERGPGSPGD